MSEKLFEMTDAGLGLREAWDGHLQTKVDAMMKNRAGRDPLRLSSAGACKRKLWYQKHHHGMSAGFGVRMIDSFAVGDAVEQILKFRLNDIYGVDYYGFRLVCKQCTVERKVYTPECAGCGSFAFFEFEDVGELEVTLTDGTVLKVPGRPDGFLRIDGEVYIVEIKTMANFTYGRAKGNGSNSSISYDYAAQATSYQKAFGIKKTIFLSVRKETGEVCFRLFEGTEEILEQVQNRFREVAESNRDTPLAREHGPLVAKAPKGALTLGFPCSYCEFVQVCYPSFAKEYIDKKDFGTGSVTKVPVLLDRSGRFATPEEAQAYEPKFTPPPFEPANVT